jgi:hypothetical protein
MKVRHTADKRIRFAAGAAKSMPMKIQQKHHPAEI